MPKAVTNHCLCKSVCNLEKLSTSKKVCTTMHDINRGYCWLQCEWVEHGIGRNVVVIGLPIFVEVLRKKALEKIFSCNISGYRQENWITLTFSSNLRPRCITSDVCLLGYLPCIHVLILAKPVTVQTQVAETEPRQDVTKFHKLPANTSL